MYSHPVGPAPARRSKIACGTISASRRPSARTCASSLPRRRSSPPTARSGCKIPLRYLDQYRFKYGQPQQGVGQGQGNRAMCSASASGDGNDPGDGQPGDQPGEHDL